MAERSARRDEVLAMVSKVLATDTAGTGRPGSNRSASRCRGPDAARRSTPAGGRRVGGGLPTWGPGGRPDYRPPRMSQGVISVQEPSLSDGSVRIESS